MTEYGVTIIEGGEGGVVLRAANSLEAACKGVEAIDRRNAKPYLAMNGEMVVVEVSWVSPQLGERGRKTYTIKCDMLPTYWEY